MNNMLELSKVKRFYDHFSLLTVGDDKTPNFPWKESQSRKQDWDVFSKNYQYKGGINKKDGEEIKATKNFGIICGFDHLECFDVDLKVFSTAQEQKDFWNEYYSYLTDNILNFSSKFGVYRTKNDGYHILYRTKRVEGNLKVAKLKGHKEAVIETRGIGGYVFAYPENHVKGTREYFNLEYITDADREILMTVSLMYNHVEEPPVEPKKEKTEFKDGEISPWQDYNDKTDIFEIIGDDFSIVKHQQKRIIIKRHGATSPHSGYIFKDSGCMYLFSTGTIYQHEKLITPFIAYATKFHNKDFSAAASQLYKDGFGSRIQKITDKKKKSLPNNLSLVKEYKVKSEKIVFPIEIFPKPIQSYIMECANKLDSNVDYMGCSLIWLISICIGNAIRVKVKNGWVEPVTVWMSIVGKAGIGKTPSINNIIFPLEKINAREIKKYLKNLEQYQEYQNLSHKEKKEHSEVDKPVKQQFIANDITTEALIDLHQDCDSGVAVFKDELAGWLKDMNKYRAGSDLEFWLSAWSGKSVNVNRISRPGSFVDNPMIPVLGGIQPQIFYNFYTEETKENGFMDRMLLSFPESQVDYFNENEMEYDVLEWYKDTIVTFFDIIRASTVRDFDNEIQPRIADFTPEAKKEYSRIFNEITDAQNDDEENEYLKSMYPKQKSYIARFALIIHAFNEFFSEGGNTLSISKESVLSAEKLSQYFVATAKKVKFNNMEVQDLKTVAKNGKNNAEKIRSMYEDNPEFNRTHAADTLGVSKSYVMRIIKEIKGEQ